MTDLQNFEEKAREIADDVQENFGLPPGAYLRLKRLTAIALRDAHESGRTEAMKLIDGRAEAAYRDGYEAGAMDMRELLCEVPRG